MRGAAFYHSYAAKYASSSRVFWEVISKDGLFVVTYGGLIQFTEKSGH
jgi:hypothetical protein